ncbi:MAG: SagB/ThcOx family dehydrogenase [Candidatus Methanoperedens sp.]|nr:SagB/ThcOx family dehydrogenase [Candidatus Methanoperedens sp.]
MMSSIGKEFIEKTKFQHLDRSDQSRNIPQPPLEMEYDASRQVIDLPAPENIKIRSFDLREAIEGRRSIRTYSKVPLTIEELSYLLWVTQGVVKVTPGATFRNVPSAGSRHALETYLLINNVRGVPEGMYRFLAMKWRYGERGYRYLHLDAGHACQNLYLGAGSVDCGVCAIAAFSDDDMNDLLMLDGVERFVIYVATVGRNKVRV